MSVARIGAGATISGWPIETGAGVGEATGTEGAALNVSLEEVAALMVQVDREQRSAARATRKALTEAARAERQAAIEAQRRAARDAFNSAVVQAVVGSVVAVAKAAVAVGTAGAATAGATAAAEATSKGVPWHRWVEIGTEVLTRATPILDFPAHSAEQNRIRAQEHSCRAAWLEDQARLAGDDAEAARSAERSHMKAVERAMQLVEEGRTIAIGRQTG